MFWSVFPFGSSSSIRSSVCFAPTPAVAPMQLGQPSAQGQLLSSSLARVTAVYSTVRVRSLLEESVSARITARYSDFYSGIFTFAHILFYVSLAILFVFLTVQRIEKRRWS